MLNVAPVEPGSSVLVTGCGGVGLNIIQGAVLAGATTIIAADVVPAKLDLATAFGATHTVRPEGGELARQVGGIAAGGVEYAFDATGAAAVVSQTFAATQPGGTTVMVGSPPAGERLEIDPAALFRSRRLMGCTARPAGGPPGQARPHPGRPARDRPAQRGRSGGLPAPRAARAGRHAVRALVAADAAGAGATTAPGRLKIAAIERFAADVIAQT